MKGPAPGDERGPAWALSRSSPEVETLFSHNPLQYLHLTSLQVRPEKLLSVSTPTHHVMQLLLVKSQLTPSCSVRESLASVMVHIIARHGLLSGSGLAPRWTDPSTPSSGTEH